MIGADAGVRGARGVRDDVLAGNRSLRSARSDDRFAVAQIEAEGDAVAADRGADLSESASYDGSVSSPTTTCGAPRSSA